MGVGLGWGWGYAVGAHYLDTKPDFSEKKAAHSGPLQQLSRALSHAAGSLTRQPRDAQPSLKQ